jgi:plastocyanin
MTRFLAALFACVVLGLAALGCGGDDDEGGGGGSAKTSEQKQPASGGGGGKVTDVSMKDIEFKPKTVNVTTGGEVKWTNDDGVGHDVTASGFKSGSAGGLSKGDSFEHRFDSAGTFKYRCTVHSGMEGSVVVK